MFLDVAGTIASLLATYYFIQLNNKAWPASLLATLINGSLYWQKGIYADMLLESFYFVSTCYGWYLWQSPTSNATKVINRLSIKQWLILSGITFSLFVLIVELLNNFTHSDITVLDGLTTSLSLTAQWLMCYKIRATWILWFVTDAIYSYMYFHKQLPFHCLLMLLYIVMSIIGYRAWAKQQKNLPPGLNRTLNPMH
ncbi:nicotinamide riboside transporter PnuC [Legionella hackeliae]|uniref:Nicotinamide riboside transporter PnuC n=1 Tax=Legionella hackeliae TaxID=449 RepID=A0A0A8UUL1_LEGHA|nr:nicotinamide riboside transporter PnuC [Legionella hackeliae]KTD15444.1 Nicotinamide riboside transporter PnuC [Legionella hackeliae]CEK11186.1 Nicotinamide mononucleotide transporter [Legionella hackeliae]